MENSQVTEKIRSKKQQASLQIFCRSLADELNDAGITQKVLMAYFNIDHSEESIKSIFREIGRIKFGKDSTSKLSTKECTSVFDELNRITSALGISVPWPSLDPLNY